MIAVTATVIRMSMILISKANWKEISKMSSTVMIITTAVKEAEAADMKVNIQDTDHMKAAEAVHSVRKIRMNVPEATDKTVIMIFSMKKRNGKLKVLIRNAIRDGIRIAIRIAAREATRTAIKIADMATREETRTVIQAATRATRTPGTVSHTATEWIWA
jgi:histidyl-tRNA synthetase